MSDTRKLKSLERENARLKLLLADAMLDNVVLKDALRKYLRRQTNAESRRFMRWWSLNSQSIERPLCLRSMPRSCSKSSTCQRESGNLRCIMTANWIIVGEVLK